MICASVKSGRKENAPCVNLISKYSSRLFIKVEIIKRIISIK
jgi:hypothetical protein